MSRIGNKPVIIPKGVTVTVTGHTVTVAGPKGELTTTFHQHVTIRETEGTLVVTVDTPDSAQDRALWGLSRMLLQNMVDGVTTGFTKALEIQGVGYRVQLKGKTLVLNLGFSHPVEYALPEKIEAKIEGNIVTISGIDKQAVGETAAQIRSFKKPEPYKGKGIRYVGEVVRIKPGKVVKASEGG